MSTEKAYLVSFCMRDYYCIQLTATCEDDAIDKAQAIYDEDYENAFELDITIGGTDDWQAEEYPAAIVEILR